MSWLRQARTCAVPAATAIRSDAAFLRVWLRTIPPSMLASSAVASTHGSASARSSPRWRIRSSASASSRSQASNPAAACSRASSLWLAILVGRQRPDRASQHPRLLEPGDKARQRFLQPGQRRHAAQGLGQPGHDLRAAVPDRRRGQLIPAAEVVVKLPLARPRGRQYLVHRGGRDSPLGKQLGGPLHYPLPAGHVRPLFQQVLALPAIEG